MTTALLHEAGEALYGPLWQSELARELGVSVRTVQRWAAGKPVPPSVWPEIRALAGRRGLTLVKVRRKLPR